MKTNLYVMKYEWEHYLHSTWIYYIGDIMNYAIATSRPSIMIFYNINVDWQIEYNISTVM